MNRTAHPASITLIVKGDPLTPVDDFAGLLIESAPDAGLPFDSDRQASMSELLGSFDDAKRRAWELTQKLLACEQPLDGVLQLRVSEELIIRELESIFLAIHLDSWLRAHPFRLCRFRAASPVIERLREIQQVTSASYQIAAPSQRAAGKMEKVRRLVSLDGQRGLRKAAVLAATHYFPTGTRYLSSLRNRKHASVRGGWWFYSTAYTYTNIGLAYEPYLPTTLNFICEDAETGGAPLRNLQREFATLYASATLSDIPRSQQLARAQHDYEIHLRAAKLSGDEAVARDVLLSGNWFQTWLTRTLPITWFQSRIFTRWMNETKPEAVVVGNAAYEGVLLQLASQAGVPTLLLQHGILGDYYQLMGYSADALLVRGTFWRDFVAPQMRERSHVLNIPYEATPPAGHPQDIVFLTSIDSALPNTHQSDFRDIVASLVRAAHQEKRRLVLRIHPRENPASCKLVVEDVCRELSLYPEISFSSGPGLEEVLRSSAVAVTYCSTVFLDCLRLGVPIVSFDWHDFSYKSLLQSHSVFNFARNLAELEQLVVQGVRAELAAPATFEQFMAPTERSALTSFFQQLPKQRKS